MGKEYIPMFLDFNEQTQDLTDEECGRLVRAIIDYANGRDYEERLIGSAERIAFRFLKGTIDRNIAISDKRAKAGSKNSKTEQNGTNENKTEQNETSEINKNNNKNENKNKNQNKNENENISEGFVDDADAQKIMHDHLTLLNAAELAGFPKTDAIRAKLIDLYADHGLEKMLSAIDSCTEYGVTTIAYLKGVLKGSPKRKAGKTVEAQKYGQRDYSGVQDELIAQQDREMEEYVKSGKGAGL